MTIQNQVLQQIENVFNQNPSSPSNAVIPYMRSIPIQFVAENLRPGRVSQFFFGDLNVSRFVQQGSVMRPDGANANVAIYGNVGSEERFYCNATHGFATAIGAANGSIYFNENFTTVNVSAVGANSLSGVVYNVGDVLVQYGPGGFPTNYHPDDIQLQGTPFYYEGQVVYWNVSTGVLVLDNQVGSITANATNTSNAGTWFYKGGVTTIISANNIVQGANKWPVGSQVVSLDNPSNKFLIGSYIHRSGSVAYTTNVFANVIATQAQPNNSIIGNVAYITGGTNAGVGGNVLSIGVDAVTGANLVFLDSNVGPLTSNSTYNLGYNYVDSTGYLMGIYTIPESPTVSFQTGTQVFTITDSPIVDDPFATMVAKGYFLSDYTQGGSQSFAWTPSYQAAVSQPAVSSQATVPSAVTSVTNATVVTAAPGPNTTYAGVISQVSANAAANGLYNGVSIQWPWALFDVDPIAQTFITPPPNSLKTNYGVFIQSIALWFNAKPVAPSPFFPVQLFIVQTNNGVPTSNVIATCSLPWDKIVVTQVPDSANIGPAGQTTSLGSITTNKTSTLFTFQDPVYLAPSTEYAMILYSESPDYEVFVSKIGQFDISNVGNGTKRISAIPNVGSFFRSQNASAWTPYNNEMMMFVMYQSLFSTLPVTFNFNAIPYGSDIPYDKILLNSTDLDFSLTDIIYKVQTTVANTLALDGTDTQVYPGTIYDFGHDLKTSSLTSARERVFRASNANSLQVQVNLGTQDANLSPMFNEELLSATIVKNIVNAGGINSNTVSITSPGNHINAANIVVTFSAPDLPDGTQATGNVAALKGNSVVSINMNYSGSGYSLTPTITISEPGAPANATAVVAGENGTSGGNAVSRYISRKVTLASGMDSGDLRVYMTCVRPAGTDINVYYKVLSGSDSQSFSAVPWVKMSMVNNLNSPDQLTPINLTFVSNVGTNGQPTGFLNYTYNGIQYPLGGTFKYFAIKIVMLADDPAVIPTVGSYQAIAYPGG